MATHYSTLGWKIPWTEERGRLQSMGRRVRHDFTSLHDIIIKVKKEYGKLASLPSLVSVYYTLIFNGFFFYLVYFYFL